MRAYAVILAAPALVLTWVGCAPKNIGPNVHLVVANNVCGQANQTVPSLARNDVMRFTFRVKDASGATISVCDALRNGAALPSVSLKYPAADSVDIFAESFDSSGNRVASGAALHQSMLKPGGTDVQLRLQAAEAFRCVPDGGLTGNPALHAHLSSGHAFHTATRLPDGEVLLVGGLSTSASGTGASADKYFINGAVEAYDPTTMTVIQVDVTPTPRAFHSAALLNIEGTHVKILLVGGISTSMPSLPSLGINSVPFPETFRLGLTGANLQAAPSEILDYDMATHTASRTPAAVPASVVHAAAFQGGADLPMGGLVVAGGYTYFGGAQTANLHIDKTADGATGVSGDLPDNRLGPGLVVESPSTAILVGGAGAMSAQLLRIDLTGAPLSAKPLTVMGGMFPSLVFPTLTLLPGAQPGILVSGGLEVVSSGAAQNPPSTAPLLLTDTGTAMLGLTQITTRGFQLACGPDHTHYRSTAFDAATLLGTNDRVLISGGTAREVQGCQDCEDGDDVLSCAVDQAIIYDVANKSVAPNPASIATPGGEHLQVPRWGHTQTLLPDGTVLVAGGFTRVNKQTQAVTDLETYNPARILGVSGSDSVELDDPIADDLRARNLARQPGTLAYAGSTSGAIKCAAVGQ